MYKKTYRIISIVFGSIGIAMFALGGFLYFVTPGSELKLKDAAGTPTGLCMNSLLLTIFSGIGLIFLMIGVLFYLIRKVKVNRQQRLIETGRVIYGDVVSVEKVVQYRINGRIPYQVIVQYVEEDTKTIYQFRSEYILEYPVYAKPGEKVKIYVDRNNKKNYYVELSSIAKNSEYRVELL